MAATLCPVFVSPLGASGVEYVDLDDGKLEQEYAAYQDWLKSIENLKLLHPPDDTKVFYQLTEIRRSKMVWFSCILVRWH